MQRPCIGEIIEALVGQSLKTWLCALHRSNIRLPAVKDSGIEEELYVSRSRLKSGAEVCKCKQRHVIEAGALNSWLACQTCRTHTFFVSVDSCKECAFSSTFELLCTYGIIHWPHKSEKSLSLVEGGWEQIVTSRVPSIAWQTTTSRLRGTLTTTDTVTYTRSRHHLLHPRTTRDCQPTEGTRIHLRTSAAQKPAWSSQPPNSTRALGPPPSTRCHSDCGSPQQLRLLAVLGVGY